MGVSDHVVYFNAITQIEAQEALLAMSIAEFPHLNKKEERKKRHKSMHQMAFPTKHSKQRSLSIDNFAGFLNNNSQKVKNGG